MSDLFASLAGKLLGGASLFLLLALGVQTWRLTSAHNTIEKRDLQIKAVAAERDRFKDALAFYVSTGQLQADRGKQALREHEGMSAELRKQADRIRTVRVAGAGCETPGEVMGAHGL